MSQIAGSNLLKNLTGKSSGILDKLKNIGSYAAELGIVAVLGILGGSAINYHNRYLSCDPSAADDTVAEGAYMMSVAAMTLAVLIFCFFIYQFIPDGNVKDQILEIFIGIIFVAFSSIIIYDYNTSKNSTSDDSSDDDSSDDNSSNDNNLSYKIGIATLLVGITILIMVILKWVKAAKQVYYRVIELLIAFVLIALGSLTINFHNKLADCDEEEDISKDFGYIFSIISIVVGILLIGWFIAQFFI